jgi:hypothetical protein
MTDTSTAGAPDRLPFWHSDYDLVAPEFTAAFGRPGAFARSADWRAWARTAPAEDLNMVALRRAALAAISNQLALGEALGEPPISRIVKGDPWLMPDRTVWCCTGLSMVDRSSDDLVYDVDVQQIRGGNGSFTLRLDLGPPT